MPEGRSRQNLGHPGTWLVGSNCEKVRLVYGCRTPSARGWDRKDSVRSNYLHASGQVIVGVPCFSSAHSRTQRTGSTGLPTHATRGSFFFPFASCYVAVVA